MALESLKNFLLYFSYYGYHQENAWSLHGGYAATRIIYLHTKLPCLDILRANSTFQFVCGYYTINISNVYFICFKTRASPQLCMMNIIERKHNTQTHSLTRLNTNWIKNYLFISGKLISAFAPWLIISRETRGSFKFYIF